MDVRLARPGEGDAKSKWMRANHRLSFLPSLLLHHQPLKWLNSRLTQPHRKHRHPVELWELVVPEVRSKSIIPHWQRKRDPLWRECRILLRCLLSTVPALSTLVQSLQKGDLAAECSRALVELGPVVWPEFCLGKEETHYTGAQRGHSLTDVCCHALLSPHCDLPTPCCG